MLYTSTHYPANYGFIPRTYANDGDPLDVLVLCSENIIPMSLVRCYPIGVIIMDDSGSQDEKIIAIPFDDPTYNGYRDIKELPSHIFDEMQHFFSVYKQLEDAKSTEISEVKDHEACLLYTSFRIYGIVLYQQYSLSCEIIVRLLRFLFLFFFLTQRPRERRYQGRFEHRFTHQQVNSSQLCLMFDKGPVIGLSLIHI